MKKIAFGSILGCMMIMTAGCGAVPEILVDTAKNSATEVIEQGVDEMVSDFADEMLDLDQLGDWGLEEVEEE